MTQTAADEHRRTITDRVCVATTHLLLLRGSRKLRTAEIAECSHTTESTIFRHLKGIEHILELTYSRAWQLINKQTSMAAFDRDLATDPVQALLGDTAAVWSMKRDPELCEAATVAFLFLRRRAEILTPDAQPCPDELRFHARIERLAQSIMVDRSPDGDVDEHRVDLLATLLMNYMATVWLTWFCMPVQSDDPLDAKHNLSPDEAQLGIIVLVDRITSDLGEMHASTSGDRD
jgi:AcrR family transcriptional regulator